MSGLKRRGIFRRINRRGQAISRFLRKELFYMIKTGAPAALIGRRFSDCFSRESIEVYYFDARKEFINFTADGEWSVKWFVDSIPMWLSAFARCGLDASSRLNALEIGSWEGMSSVFILRNFPEAHLTCVDTWSGADEHNASDDYLHEQVSSIERRFDQNLAPFADRLTKVKGTSLKYFTDTDTRKVEYDFAYIDGSHFSTDVLVDAVFAWDKLRVGGLAIFDDYFWKYYVNSQDNPGAAINAFLRMKAGSWEIVHSYQQVIVRKTKSTAPVVRGTS